MCACIELLETRHSPGERLSVWEGEGISRRLPWSGFARREILEWWLRHGARLVDVPAERFGTRSDVSGELVWSEVPPGRVIRGLVARRDAREHLRIVTREAGTLELLHCQHLRMPLVERPLFSAASPATEGLPLFESSPADGDACERRPVQEILL